MLPFISPTLVVYTCGSMIPIPLSPEDDIQEIHQKLSTAVLGNGAVYQIAGISLVTLKIDGWFFKDPSDKVIIL